MLCTKLKSDSHTSTFLLQLNGIGSSLHGKYDIQDTFIAYFSNKPS